VDVAAWLMKSRLTVLTKASAFPLDLLLHEGSRNFQPNISFS
jgi:hypothetical protein